MPLKLGSPRPELSGATEWLGREPGPGELHGRPVLVHFWAVSCHICHENMPAVARWRGEYGPQGLVVVAVHMPREPSDTDVVRVREDAQAMRLIEPCAIDNRLALADRFENRWVPAYFLFDRDGRLRNRAAGTTGIGLVQRALAREFEPRAVEGGSP